MMFFIKKFISGKDPKIFVIGLGKTGTTTLHRTLTDLGLNVGDQVKGEQLINDWYKRNFSSIFEFCNTADAFQDVPFCLPYTYQALDAYFPGSKFILSVRDSAEQWYNSLTSFHSKLWADGVRIPTAEDLKGATYLYKGRPYDTIKMIYNTPDEEIYHKEKMIDFYRNHNTAVQNYFRSAPHKLITINVSVKEDYMRLCTFLNKEPAHEQFPWENKT